MELGEELTAKNFSHMIESRRKFNVIKKFMYGIMAKKEVETKKIVLKGSRNNLGSKHGKICHEKISKTMVPW